MPQCLKPYFNEKVNFPSLYEHYDAIGFDAESLIQFDTKNMLKLLIDTYLIELVEAHDYPAEILKFDWKRLDGLLTEAIWDFDTGYLLNIDEMYNFKGF